MSATPKDVINEIRKTLDSNLTDPNPSRSSDTDWIYTIPINFDIADFPRIHIHQVSETHQGLSVGSTDRWTESRVQITVFTGIGDGWKLDIDNDGEKENPNRVLSSLEEDVINEINDNQSSWRALGNGGGEDVYSVLTFESNYVPEQQTQFQGIKQEIDCMIKMNR